MHAIAVVLDFVQPVVARRCFVYKARQLRLDPCWWMSRLGDRCHRFDLAPWCAGSTVNLHALWHTGYLGRGGVPSHATTPRCDRLPAIVPDHRQWCRRRWPSRSCSRKGSNDCKVLHKLIEPVVQLWDEGLVEGLSRQPSLRFYNELRSREIWGELANSYLIAVALIRQRHEHVRSSRVKDAGLRRATWLVESTYPAKCDYAYARSKLEVFIQDRRAVWPLSRGGFVGGSKKGCRPDHAAENSIAASGRLSVRRQVECRLALSTRRSPLPRRSPSRCSQVPRAQIIRPLLQSR
jgi:hypothetical protein